MIQISDRAAQAIADHARRTYPDECVGLLLGTLSPPSADTAHELETSLSMQIVAVYPVENRWEGQITLADSDDPTSRRDRFYLDPRDYLRADRAASQQGLDVVGCYHSHPDSPAVPSERDRVGAQGVGSGTQFVFLIQSVDAAAAAELRGWFLRDNGARFAETALAVTPTPDA